MDNNISKVFTESEFNKRVEIFWKLMVQSEFPSKQCPPIEHDRAKRRTRNLGICHYKPAKLSFSYRVLDGRYSLRDVDNIVRHEIGHMIAYLRTGKSQGHNDYFCKLGREFDFDPNPTCSLEIVEEFKEKVKEEKISKAKYKLYCKCCGKEWFKTRKSGVIDNPENYICPCKAKNSLRVQIL